MLNSSEIDDLINKTINDNRLNKINDNLYLSNRQIEILQRYKINYNKFTSLKDLIYEIESIINENNYLEDLENLSIELSEFNYYHNTNK